jgi:ATP-dependent protease HslVU (ClpYQ) peptidase subunit
MTCIVAIEHQGQVIMGGDSASSDGWRLSQVRRPKVFVRDDLIFGYTSSFRMGDLLQYSLAIPIHEWVGEGETLYDDDEYICKRLIPDVRECLSKGGFTKIEHSKEEGGTFLVGYHGRIYEVSDDFGVTTPVAGFTAVGSGYLVALGSLYTSSHYGDWSPMNRVGDALDAAAAFTGSVRGPFTIMRL